MRGAHFKVRAAGHLVSELPRVRAHVLGPSSHSPEIWSQPCPSSGLPTCLSPSLTFPCSDFLPHLTPEEAQCQHYHLLAVQAWCWAPGLLLPRTPGLSLLVGAGSPHIREECLGCAKAWTSNGANKPGSRPLLCAPCGPGALLSPLYVASLWNCTAALGDGGWLYSHFTGGETEAQRGQGHTVTRSQAGVGAQAVRRPTLRNVPLC